MHVERQTMIDRPSMRDCVVAVGVPPANEITVLFDDTTTTFAMPASATWADLAQRLAAEDGSSPRHVVSVVVKLNRETRCQMP
jgi:hypothetical protein